VSKGSMKSDLQILAMKIFDFTAKNAIHLEVEWVPRDENNRQDYLSKIVKKDDWGIDIQIIGMIVHKWECLRLNIMQNFKHFSADFGVLDLLE